ncbi:uncharacterized protein MAL13P1.304-like [Centruroides sculpturatus]|uniref:uncharacterized protein MAL13P1.304-like n=1 Tax=Centruroides sculpturatus TaxID=218467 RepID=UPI000C6E22BA|nr:uncharacterized protein MAL13P1.304-like [Centruroides sculpturatus]
MSEEKINIKKSMLSPDVAPFVPRNFNVNYYGLSNYHSEINDTGFITNLSGIEIPQPSKWESPIIYPASFLHNPIYPFTHVIAPECSFQTAPIIDSKCFVSTIESEMTNKSSFQPKKHHASRKSKKYVEISEGNVQSNPNVQKKEKKKKGNSSSKTNQISSDLSNFKIKSNCSEHKQIKSRTDTNETPVKFDSNIEFPTLPSISNKTDSVDENKPLSYNSSYSSVLKFESKTVLKLDKTSNNKFPNKSIHVSDNCKNIEKSDEILHNADKKHEKMKNRNFSRTKNVSKNKEHFQQGKNQIDFHQRDNIQISEPNKVLQKNSPSKDLSKKSNTPKEEKEVLQVNAQSVENKGKETLEKPEKTKKKRRNKKKKKTDGGKVSLLSPEMFAAITKQFVKSSEYKYNNFNLSDAEEFPDLGSTSSKNNELSNTHNDTKDKSLSSKSVIKNQAITPEIVPDSTHISSVDSWKYSTFSSILKMNNPPANSVNKEEIHKEKLEDNSIIQKEEPSSSKIFDVL